MRMMLKLPPGAVLVAFNADDCAALLKAASLCPVLLETETALTRMPEGHRDGDQYLSFVRGDDPRMEALVAEVTAEQRAKAMDSLARLEATLTGAPVEVKPLASVVPHRRRGEEDA